MTDETLLYRQVHPTFVKPGGQVTSQAFYPLGKCVTQLSAYDGRLIGARESWLHFRDTGNASAGVMGVEVKECQDLSLSCKPAPEDFREHVHIDFRDIERNKYDKVGKRLKDKAVKRGWCYQEDEQHADVA